MGESRSALEPLVRAQSSWRLPVSARVVVPWPCDTALASALCCAPVVAVSRYLFKTIGLNAYTWAQGKVELLSQPLW